MEYLKQFRSFVGSQLLLLVMRCCLGPYRETRLSKTQIPKKDAQKWN